MTLREDLINIIVRDKMDRQGIDPEIDPRAVPGSLLGKVASMRANAEPFADQIIDLLLRGRRETGNGERSIEEHLAMIAPREGFDPGDITDADRRAIARTILDAYIIGIGWLTRDANTGFKRED